MRASRALLLAVASAMLAAAGTLAWQIWRTIHRPDLPSLTNQDISGVWGDPAAPPLRVVAVGDSSLTCPGLADLDDAWLRRIILRYRDRHRVELISLGVGGSRVQDVVRGTLDAAVAARPDVAVVSVGGNDVIYAVPVAEYAASLDGILRGLEQASGAVLLVGVGDLGAIPRLPPLLRPLLTFRSAQFDRAGARLAAGRPRVVKAPARGEGSTASRSDLALFAADQFHGSAAGHRLYGEAIAPAFEAAYRIWSGDAAQGGPLPGGTSGL